MLLAMFIRYFLSSQPHYPSMEPNQRIAYISDVGAYSLKPLFITGCVITTIFLDLSFFAERYLRHTGRLARNTSRTQKVLSIISIVFAVAGSAGLILLAIFDTYRHPRMHDGFLLLFIAGFIFSAIFICAEYQRLGIHYRDHRILRISFWVKLSFILLEIAMAAAFIGTSFTGNRNVAAILEWIVALTFTGYVISFLLDLLPSVRTKHHAPQGFEDQTPMRKTGSGRGGGRGDRGVSVHGAGPGEYEQNLTNDSAGPVGNPSYPHPSHVNGYENGVNGYTNGKGGKAGWANRWRNF
jgi:Frag1/DRAM/Sfk1 family